MENSGVLFITAFHPGGKGIIGAGEAICEDSLRTLISSGRPVHVLCVAPASQTANSELVEICRSYTSLIQTTMQNMLGVFYSCTKGSLFAPWLFARVSPRNIKAAQDIILRNRIGEVWLDFPMTLGFATYLRGLETDYFVHDVVSQNIGRRRLLGRLAHWVKRVEQKLLLSVRRCFVLSQKDADLLRDMGYEGEIQLRHPSVPRVGEVSGALPVTRILSEFNGRKNLVFFGNMRRPENHFSILHFLLFSYPKVRRCHPDVQFWVLGLLPRVSLKILGRMIPGVRVVGAVDDPRLAFEAASLCVVPLRRGAGVKIKVLQMLDAGAKVVASPIGGEGIPTSPNLIVVPNDEIPETLCRMLSKACRKQTSG